ncbi:MAG: zinc ribbon domain-containing protein [Clostridiales bacterium]|nr:zinc ribbon domain-containing protein [Clostridiales bacterium]
MVTCPNCGEQYENPGKFCSKCGTPLEADSSTATPDTAVPEVSPAPQYDPAPESAPVATLKKSRKTIVMAAVVAAVLLVAIVLSVVLLGGALKSPAAKFIDIHKNMYLSPLSSAVSSSVDAITSKSSNALAYSGDMTLSFNSRLDDYYYSDTNAIFNALSIGLSADISSKEGLFGFIVSYDDDALLSGTITADKDSIGIQLPELDSKYYTITLDALLNMLEENGIPIDSDSANETKELFKELSGKDVQKLLDDISEILTSCVTKENVTKEKRKIELSYLDKDVECTVYTFTPDEDDIEAMLKKLADYLESSKTAYELFYAVYGLSYIGTGYETDDAQIRDDYDDFIDELRANARDIGTDMADSDFTWITAVNGKRVYLDKIIFRDSYSSTVSISYESYGEPKDGRRDAIVIEDEWDSMVLSSEYELDGKKLKGSLSLCYDYEDIEIEYDVDISKKSSLGLWYGTYKVNYDGDRVCKLSVDEGKSGGSDHEFAAYTDDGTFTAILNTSDKKSKIKLPSVKPTDISDYTLDELADIFEDMGRELEDIMYDLYDKIYY